LELNDGAFTIRIDRVAESSRIQLYGEMDMAVTGHVDREMRRAEATDAERIVLDLDELEFLDASGIRLLLDLSARSDSDGGRLRIRRARSSQVQRVIDLTGVGDVLPFVD
jgi:anti-anti-sigma factor